MQSMRWKLFSLEAMKQATCPEFLREAMSSAPGAFLLLSCLAGEALNLCLDGVFLPKNNAKTKQINIFGKQTEGLAYSSNSRAATVMRELWLM